MDKICFLGTGAADWDKPDDNRFFRRNASVLINENLLVDCGGNLQESIDWSELDGVTDVLITHDHPDHMCTEIIEKLSEKRKIRLGCDKYVKGLLRGCENIEFVDVTFFKQLCMGQYSVIPVPANHYMIYDGESQACHYIITLPSGKRVFYGTDGAWILRPSWQEMLKYKFDIMIFDCTVGDKEDWRLFEHNTIPMLRLIVNAVKEQKLLNEGGSIIATHFAKTLHASHDETSKILKEFDVLAAKDEMTVDF